MNKTCKKLSLIFIATVLVSACYQNGNGVKLDKKSNQSVEHSTINQTTTQIRDVTSSAAATAAAKREALNQ